MITSNRLFHGLIGRGKTHIINFNDNFSISDFEMLLKNQCRLYAQVFVNQARFGLKQQQQITGHWSNKMKRAKV